MNQHKTQLTQSMHVMRRRLSLICICISSIIAATNAFIFSGPLAACKTERNHFVASRLIGMALNNADAATNTNTATSLESTLLDNPNRQVAIDFFQQAAKNANAKVVPDQDVINSNSSILINSLVFLANNNDVTPLLLIVPSKESVDVDLASRAVSDTLNSSTITRIKLAPSDLVENVCGFPPGCVPPFGHVTPLLTLVDSSLKNMILLGGGGRDGYTCEITANDLIAMDQAHVADLVVSDDTTRREALLLLPKPFFSVETPDTRQAQLYLSSDSQEYSNTPLEPVPVTVFGRLGGVRQIARRLVFCDLLPPTAEIVNGQVQDEYPWRSGSDGKDMAVQVIAGKTLCEQLSDDDGVAAMKALKSGKLAIIKGQTNTRTRDSLRNWVDKRSLDIVITSFQIIEEEEPKIFKATQANVAKPRLVQSSFQTSTVRPPSTSTKHTVSASAASFLKLTDIFESPEVLVVDDLESVNAFSETISQVLLSLTTYESPDNGDAKPIGVSNVTVGLDCEWKPSSLLTYSGDPQAVSLLQISVQSHQQVYLLDVCRLIRPLQPESEDMTEIEASVSDVLQNLFSSTKILKTGFQVVTDLRRLAASFPHIPAFHTIHAVVEISSLAKQAISSNKKRRASHKRQSLAALTESLTGKTLNKEQQVSDWEQRPMSSAQMTYASLDAAVTPFLLEKIFDMMDVSLTRELSTAASAYELGRWKGDQSFNKQIVSWRFVNIQTDDSKAIQKLKAKTVVGDALYVSQNWPTGHIPPLLPSPPSSAGDGSYTDKRGILRIPCKTITVRQSKDDSANPAGDLVGKRMGKSKERCLEALLQGTASLSPGSQLDFYQRSGYVEFQDAVALFVNMPNKNSQIRRTSYPNKWLHGGKMLTWFIREKDWKNGTTGLAEKLLSTDNNEYAVPSAFLFVRMGRDEFICCGGCSAIILPAPERCEDGAPKTIKSWELRELYLVLHDWERLSDSDEFVELVNFQWTE